MNRTKNRQKQGSKNRHNNSEKGGSRREHSRKEKFTPKPKKEFVFKKIEYPQYVCPRCGEQIEELSSAVADKESGEPVHFTCVLEFLKNAENLGENEEVIYIGNVNFAVAFFENPRIRKKFKIKKLIEWEDKNKVYDWKKEIAELASRV